MSNEGQDPRPSKPTAEEDRQRLLAEAQAFLRIKPQLDAIDAQIATLRSQTAEIMRLLDEVQVSVEEARSSMKTQVSEIMAQVGVQVSQAAGLEAYRACLLQGDFAGAEEILEFYDLNLQ